MTTTIDVEFERDVVASCLRDEDFVRAALPTLSRHNFSSKPLAFLWDAISTNFVGSRELVTPRLLFARIDRDFAREEERDFMLDVVRGLYARKPAAPRSSLDQIREFVRLTSARDTVGEILEGLDSGDLARAEAAMIAGIERARKVVDDDEPVEWATSASARLDRYRREKSIASIKTPLESLNRFLGGGMRPGHLGLIVATTNVGKSSLATDFGYCAAFHSDAAVIHLTTEEPEFEQSARYDSRFTGIERSKFLRGDLSEAEEIFYLDRFKRREAEINRIAVKEIGTGGSAVVVRLLAEWARRKHPTRPLLVIVDTPDQLKMPGKSESKRLDATDVYLGLRGMALDKSLAPIAVWAVTHAPAAFEGKSLTPKAVSESYDKARCASVMVGAEEKGDLPSGKKTIVVRIVKNRLGPVKHYRIYTEADFGICKFEEVAGCEEDEE